MVTQIYFLPVDGSEDEATLRQWPTVPRFDEDVTLHLEDGRRVKGIVRSIGWDDEGAAWVGLEGKWPAKAARND